MEAATEGSRDSSSTQQSHQACRYSTTEMESGKTMKNRNSAALWYDCVEVVIIIEDDIDDGTRSRSRRPTHREGAGLVPGGKARKSR
jgi:hypothetical protein